ncbi:MAG: alkaline phosphatase family protein [Bacteroidetes bacterium]|nr:alkaline phosphatase family protein [Bacteroidota bacterium]
MRTLIFCGYMLLVPVVSAAQNHLLPLQVTRLAFGSCAHEDKPQPIWEAINRIQPEVFVFVGDNIYGDTEDMALLKAKYARLGAKTGYQALKKQSIVLATWDDHDYGVNDGGHTYPKKEESKQILLDFFDEPKDTPRRQRPGIYESYLIGSGDRTVQVILLDERTFRSLPSWNPTYARGKWLNERADGLPYGPYIPDWSDTCSMLGEAQWQWLEAELRKPATFRIVASSTRFAAGDDGMEIWMNYPRDQKRMTDLIKRTKAEGIVFISGDIHQGDLSVLPVKDAYPLYDLTSSGLTQVWRHVVPNTNRVASAYLGPNFGLVTFLWEEDPKLVLEVRDEQGQVRIHHIVPRSVLRFAP